MANFSKFFLVLGGFVGFTLSFFVGYFVGNEAIVIVQKSAVGCLAGFIFAKILLWVIISTSNSKNQNQEKEDTSEILSRNRRPEISQTTNSQIQNTKQQSLQNQDIQTKNTNLK